MAKKKEAKTGRPFLGRTQAIKVTVTPEEFADLLLRAARSGIPRVAAYLRAQLGLEP